MTACNSIHPATCFAFLTLVTSLFILCRSKSGTARIASLLTFGLSILAVAFTTIVFLIDVITVAILRTKISDATRSLIVQKVPGGEIRRHAVGHGMVTLREDAWAKACAGLTTVAEILRVTQEDT